jgi:LexA-binding, inner membrane-associated putative hydrolase
VIARSHWKCAAAAWLVGAAGAALVAPVDPVTVVGLGALAAAGGLGPDLDKPPEGRKPGATAAEAHGLISNALAKLVSATHGGHRGITHRYTYAAGLGVLVAELAYLWPLATVATLAAWTCAWPLYVILPRSARWSAAVLAPLGTAAAWWLGVLPLTPWAGAAFGLGWAAHIACDHLQSATFELGGLTERIIAAGCLALAGLASLWLLTPHHFS